MIYFAQQKTSIWNKKNAGINSRNQKDAEELEKERNEIEKSRSMLEAKAKLYEQMTTGSSIPGNVLGRIQN